MFPTCPDPSSSLVTSRQKSLHEAIWRRLRTTLAYFSPVFVFQKMTQWSTLSGFRNAYTTVFRKYPHWEGGGGEEGREGGRRGEREGGKKVDEGKVEGEERRVEEEERGEETDTHAK